MARASFSALISNPVARFRSHFTLANPYLFKFYQEKLRIFSPLSTTILCFSLQVLRHSTIPGQCLSSIFTCHPIFFACFLLVSLKILLVSLEFLPLLLDLLGLRDANRPETFSFASLPALESAAAFGRSGLKGRKSP